MRLPSVFLSHGTPMLALQEPEDDAFVRNVHAWFSKLPEKPRAVVVVSAHGLSEEGTVEISAVTKNSLIYDFRGFPAALYQVRYEAPGAPDLVPRLIELISSKGFRTEVTGRGIDHGVWVPLRVAFPDAEIPIIQVSLPHPSQPEKVLLLGKALGALRDEGVLIVGSGGMVHNLHQLQWNQKHGDPLPWARAFAEWVQARLRAKDVGAIVDFEAEAPFANLAHPTIEHFYPIFITLGASLPGDELDWIHEGYEYGTLSMDCFALRG